jgi:hypothetical protein
MYEYLMYRLWQMWNMWSVKNAVFSDVTRCDSCKNRRSYETYFLLTATEWNILQYGILQSHGLKNLKSYMWSAVDQLHRNSNCVRVIMYRRMGYMLRNGNWIEFCTQLVNWNEKGKPNLVKGRGGLYFWEMLRIPHCLENRLTDGGEFVRPKCRWCLTPQNRFFFCLWCSFLLEAEQTPGSSCSQKD